MSGESLFLAILMFLPAGVLCFCSRKYMYEMREKKIGYNECDSDDYVKGFFDKEKLYRFDPYGDNEYNRLRAYNKYKVPKEEKSAFYCCPYPYEQFSSKIQVVYADWNRILDITNRWVHCPEGYFLQGFYLLSPYKGLISNIEDGKCAKQPSRPNYYDSCHSKDCSSTNFDCSCPDDYYVAGLFKKVCDDFNCVSSLKCCMIAKKPADLDELSKVKTYVMDKTVVDIANLAHHLGYGYCLGCRALKNGEGYIRDGDTWRADQSRGCKGHKHNQRLAMVYNDWGISLKDVKYSKPRIEEIKSDIIDSGTIYNYDDTDVEMSVERTETSVRSVRHTATSSWKQGHELGLEVTYKPTSSVTISGSYKFNYESSASTTDEQGFQQTHAMTVNTKKTVYPHSAVKWDLVLSKTRTTVTYTATVKMKFSVELQGFLRTDSNNNRNNANYHYKYRESHDQPTFNYKFGNQSVPFYTALNGEVQSNHEPWLWHHMTFSNPAAIKRITALKNEQLYEFQLTGKFQDVIGKHINVRWTAISLNNTSPFKFQP